MSQMLVAGFKPATNVSNSPSVLFTATLAGSTGMPPASLPPGLSHSPNDHLGELGPGHRFLGPERPVREPADEAQAGQLTDVLRRPVAANVREAGQPGRRHQGEPGQVGGGSDNPVGHGVNRARQGDPVTKDIVPVEGG